MAVDSEDRTVDPTDVLACKFCLLGALDKCYPGQAEIIKTKLYANLHEASIAVFNDTHTFEDVHSLTKGLDI